MKTHENNKKWCNPGELAGQCFMGKLGKEHYHLSEHSIVFDRNHPELKPHEKGLNDEIQGSKKN